METKKAGFFSSLLSTGDRWLTIVVVVLHVGSYIHFYRLTSTAICRHSNTHLKGFWFLVFFKRWTRLQSPSALQMLSITFYLTFTAHISKSTGRLPPFGPLQCRLFMSIGKPGLDSMARTTQYTQRKECSQKEKKTNYWFTYNIWEVEISFKRSHIKHGCSEGRLTWVTPGWVLVVLVYRYGKVPVNKISKTK